MQCKYYQTLLVGKTCEWLLRRGSPFIEVVFKAGSVVFFSTLLVVFFFQFEACTIYGFHV